MIGFAAVGIVSGSVALLLLRHGGVCSLAEIASQSDLDELLPFVRQLGERTHKRVMITPENDQQHPFISYEPVSGDFKYHKVAV